MARQTSRADGATHMNKLRRGRTYRAHTRSGSAHGEYLGMETPYGDWAILLRNGSETCSIALGDVLSIEPTAA